MSSYRDLQVWRKAMGLVLLVYRHTQRYPRHEQFGLTTQTRRAAVSIPANIAEGQAQQRPGRFQNSLRIALGSAAELETHLEIAKALQYLEQEDADALLSSVDEVGRMIQGPLKSLDRRAGYGRAGAGA